jgi:hypothetical protein
MNSFKNFITEQKNTHMTHVEDSVIYGGVDGTRQAINALRELRNLLSGSHKGSVSVKWDGAPAIFAGIVPAGNEDAGKFFVAKKGVFNASPKYYTTNAEVDEDTSGDLAEKLKFALAYLPALGIKGVIQGDFLYGPGDLKYETVDGQEYLTFHPNTIVYAVPKGTAAEKEIKKSKIGIVWHTSYTGSDFQNMKASFGVDVSKLKNTPNVWSQDAMLRDLTKATMSKKDTDEINTSLSEIGKLFNQISSSTLKILGSNRELAQTIETFNNTFVRKGEVITDTKKHVDQLVKWINARYQKEIDSRKTERGKAAQIEKRDMVLQFFSPENKQNLRKIFELQKLIVLVKLKLINTLNKLQTIDTFIKTRNGFKVTGAEGYVAIDKLSGGALKIVDRMEFSYNNFSPEILKGWDKAGKN